MKGLICGIALTGLGAGAFGCATVKQVEPVVVADLSLCKPEEQELVHAALPLVADYAICVALNHDDTSQCQAQFQAMTRAAKDSAIGCGLALIQKADQDATARHEPDASSGD
jgi:hypothetical protein